MNRRPRAVLALLGALATFLSIAGCGGSGDPDRKELDRIKTVVASSYDAREVERLLTEAITIGTRHGGTPLGDEALAFAEQAFLDRVPSFDFGLFADRVPAPDADVEDDYLVSFQSLAGFIDALPADYPGTAVRERLRTAIAERVEHYLFRMETALDNRQQWADELRSAGSTELSFNGQEGEDGFAQYVLSLRYLRQLVERTGESAAFLDDLDVVLAALVVADYSPASSTSTYENGVFLTTYSEQAVAEAEQNTAELATALATARERFPAAA